MAANGISLKNFRAPVRWRSASWDTASYEKYDVTLLEDTAMEEVEDDGLDATSRPRQRLETLLSLSGPGPFGSEEVVTHSEGKQLASMDNLHRAQSSPISVTCFQNSSQNTTDSASKPGGPLGSAPFEATEGRRPDIDGQRPDTAAESESKALAVKADIRNGLHLHQPMRSLVVPNQSANTPSLFGASTSNSDGTPTSGKRLQAAAKGRLGLPDIRLDLGAVQRLRDINGQTELQSRRDKFAFFEKECSHILDHVFLGSDVVARNLETLQRAGITHVLNCVGFVCSEHFPNHLTYKTLWLQDTPGEDISSVLYDVFDYIEDVRRLHGRIFVHCCQGVSRSTSLVIAYVMWRENLPFEEAFRFVKAARGVTNPNMGFACQLLQWQKRVLKPSPNASPPSPNEPPNVRMCRLAPHSPFDVGHLVPKPLIKATSAGLDSRGAFIVQMNGSVYTWQGAKCSQTLGNAAATSAQQILHYERLEGEVTATFEGGEPPQFWQVMAIEGGPDDGASRSASMAVPGPSEREDSSDGASGSWERDEEGDSKFSEREPSSRLSASSAADGPWDMGRGGTLGQSSSGGNGADGSEPLDGESLQQQQEHSGGQGPGRSAGSSSGAADRPESQQVPKRPASDLGEREGGGSPNAQRLTREGGRSRNGRGRGLLRRVSSYDADFEALQRGEEGRGLPVVRQASGSGSFIRPSGWGARLLTPAQAAEADSSAAPFSPDTRELVSTRIDLAPSLSDNSASSTVEGSSSVDDRSSSGSSQSSPLADPSFVNARHIRSHASKSARFPGHPHKSSAPPPRSQRVIPCAQTIPSFNARNPFASTGAADTPRGARPPSALFSLEGLQTLALADNATQQTT
eukprot:TRINITY_DN23038_c0_g1_i1.p1 TRINITY_DN23038_c0_g1~~TRINITY_DN23038_c0_g1_i1.p1  ORF type:complete len:858 (+),score=149.34 TRINITY_DN23038_c0_g1_i1:204-2777(+)